MAIKWNDGDRNGTGLVDFFDSPNPHKAIKIFEAAAGTKGDWDYDEDTGFNWWGLVGTYKGIVFTLYTHKSGSIKIGAYGRDSLDLVGLKRELGALVAGREDNMLKAAGFPPSAIRAFNNRHED